LLLIVTVAVCALFAVPALVPDIAMMIGVQRCQDAADARALAGGDPLEAPGAAI
jgi:hypothetical protein